MSQSLSEQDREIIRLEKVSFGSMRDPDRAVAENVTWSVTRGDFWVVAGLHGTGKSDLLMLLGGVVPPLQGNYWFMGEPMPIYDDARLATRLKLGLVFDTGQLFNQLTIRENIALPLQYHANLAPAHVEEKVQGLVDELELGPWTEQTPGAIGRNIQKRVGLGRALILQPELLLLDNPFGGLDPRQIEWWLDFLRKLAAGHPLLDHKPVTLIASASDLRLWRTCARQCAVLRGRSLQIVEDWRSANSMPADLVRELMPET